MLTMSEVPGDDDEVLEERESFERDTDEVEPLDPRNKKDERRAYAQRVGVAVQALEGARFDELHGPSVAFLNEYHEKRVRKASREWFAATTRDEHEGGGCALFVALCDGIVLGVSAAKDSGYGSGFTVTHPDYRRLGIGTSLVRAKLGKVPAYTTRVALDNAPCLYLMFKSGLVATSIAVNEANGKTVVRFETSSGRRGTVPSGPGSLKIAPKRMKATVPRWVVVSRVPLEDVTASGQLMVAKVEPINESPETVTVNHGIRKVEYDDVHRLPGLWLYRDEARAAKRAYAEERGLVITRWEDVCGARKR